MTNFITRNHKQTIVYWKESGRNAQGGSTFAAPVEILGRWIDKQISFSDNTGKETVSSAIVSLGQDVKAGDWLFLGALGDIASAIDETNPNKVADAHEIGGFNKIPDLRGRKFTRRALLNLR
jgi:hypothetical protein